MPKEYAERLAIELEARVNAKLQTYEDQLAELRQLVAEQKVTDEEAADRIARLEEGFDDIRSEMRDITKELAQINAVVAGFAPKLDRFFDNLWKVVFALLTIIGALVGVKLF